MYIAALLKFNVLKRKNQALENALTEKQQALQQGELEWLTEKIKVFTEEEQEAILEMCIRDRSKRLRSISIVLYWLMIEPKFWSCNPTLAGITRCV